MAERRFEDDSPFWWYVDQARGLRVGPAWLGTPWWITPSLGSSTQTALCPDLLRYEQIGEADGWRGRVVRGFFWILRLWPGAPHNPETDG